jgi:hypothetical protein
MAVLTLLLYIAYKLFENMICVVAIYYVGFLGLHPHFFERSASCQF